jgi:hypothetical protein
MFLSSFQKFRIGLLSNTQISSLVHIGFNSFPELNSKFALAAAFVLVKSEADLIGTYFDLNSASKSANKEEVFEEKIAHNSFYCVDRNQFKAIPGNPINYWAGKETLRAFLKYPPLGNLLDVRQGMATTDNKTYLRLWQEISFGNIAFSQRNALEANKNGLNWFPYNKGGDYRKWFGNNNYIIFFTNNGDDLIKMVREKYPKISDPEFVIKNRKYYFRESITWSFVGLLFGTRYSDCGFIFDVGGSSAFSESKSDLLYFTGLLCSKLSNYFLQSLNPSLNFQVENVQSIPSMKIDKDFEAEIIDLVNENIEISKEDWNSFENSWAFLVNPLFQLSLKNRCSLNKLYSELVFIWNEKVQKMKCNEERLNSIFINLYQLQNEVEPEIPIKEVTLTCNPAFRYGTDNNNNEYDSLL